MQDNQIRIALPSKGRMEEDTLRFLEGCGLRVNKRNPRQYSASIPALPGVMVLFQRATDIPDRVASGDVDLGITGYDGMTEVLGPDPGNVITIHEGLGYGECSLVVAVPEDWDDVQSVSDLATRASSGKLRAATKYGNTMTRFLAENGVEGVRIVKADGALESAPTIGFADFVVDITSTGTTLRENRLRILDGGTILNSQAILIGNREALETRLDLLETTRHLLEFIEAHMRARSQYMIFANIRAATIGDIRARIFEQPDLGGLQGPTIAPMLMEDRSNNWWAINFVTSADCLYPVIQQLREIGGSGVVVTPVTYIFEEQPVRYQRLLATLNLEGSAS